jgi:hypothetical protein
VFKDESHDKINDDGRAECEERQIDKIHPDMGCPDPQFFSPPFTNTKGLLLKPISYLIDHFSAKL